MQIENFVSDGPLKKTSEVDAISLEKKTMSEKLKNIKEVKDVRKVHVSSGYGKGKVNIISEEDTKEDPVMTELENEAREKRDKELDELNALKDKHLYSTSALNSILERAKANRTNSVVDVKYVSDMIHWYVSIRATLPKIMPKILDTKAEIVESYFMLCQMVVFRILCCSNSEISMFVF
ncbi:unnamed protein product [Lactuca saligna]|uniref:Uncharacterized protein n=1 Tax=Lactuca saligna TaxID=75948 RepID=A0AA35YPS7_LACSI|nr:unnamed protein product [Lactuca saligna]